MPYIYIRDPRPRRIPFHWNSLELHEPALSLGREDADKPASFGMRAARRIEERTLYLFRGVECSRAVAKSANYWSGYTYTPTIRCDFALYSLMRTMNRLSRKTRGKTNELYFFLFTVEWTLWIFFICVFIAGKRKSQKGISGKRFFYFPSNRRTEDSTKFLDDGMESRAKKE